MAQELLKQPLSEKKQSSYVAPLAAKTNAQKAALRLLEEGRKLVILTGSAGTGKSLLAVYRAACLLARGEVKKVYLARPAVVTGKTIGLLPGEADEKLLPYFRQTLAHFERLLGKSATEYHLRVKNIEMVPTEYLRGMSFEDCFVLVEEAQNFDHSDMEMVLTRLGDNTQMVFTGDTKQNDLKTTSGLKTTVEMIYRIIEDEPDYLSDDDLDCIEAQVGIVHFMPEDVVRSGLTRAFVKVYYNSGGAK